jgi:uncharacterized membrane protein YkvA (DUF1232 family)
VRYLLSVVVTVAVLWVAFVVVLFLIRPRGMNLREARAVVPDTVRLLRSLHGDRELPAGVRRWLGGLLVYLAIPVDLVPDFVPLLGYADDVIVVAFALRRVIRLAGPAALEEHWRGSAAGLAAIRRIAGLSDPQPGEES